MLSVWLMPVRIVCFQLIDRSLRTILIAGYLGIFSGGRASFLFRIGISVKVK